MSIDNCTETFKEFYSQLNSHQQDLATRWLDLGNYTLLYRYGNNYRTGMYQSKASECVWVFNHEYLCPGSWYACICNAGLP